MQLLNVSGRLCAVDSGVRTATVERLLAPLPEGVYIAISSIDSAIPGLEIVNSAWGVAILGPEGKKVVMLHQKQTEQEVVLPRIPKEVMLPTIKPEYQVRQQTKNSNPKRAPRLLQLPTLWPSKPRGTAA